ncbi:BamA/TamA family outer membrane protein [Bacteroidota bacterium]
MFITITSLSGCLGLRQLEDDQILLYRQKISGNKDFSKEKLEEFYRQKPNKRIPLIQVAPYVYFYHWGQNAYNAEKYQAEKVKIEEKYDRKISSKGNKPEKIANLERKKQKKKSKVDNKIEEGNLLMRWGEPISVYDSSLRDETIIQLSTYMKTKGFFESKVESRYSEENKLIFINYDITEGEPHILDSIIYNSNDPVIDSLIHTHHNEKLLNIGDNYDQDNLVKERERIETLLQDNGFYAFSRQYIKYFVDTSGGQHRVQIEMLINKPVSGYTHKKFMVDSVIFTTDAGLNPPNTKRFYSTFNGITYKYLEDIYSRKILDRRVFIYPGQLYSRNHTIETQRQLANLDNFKFINIVYDSSESHFIANIFASPLKKYQTTNEVGLTVTEGFPGPYYNLTLKTRNIFGGLENFEISGQIGYEGIASASDNKIYESWQSGASMNLIFPQFVLPLSTERRNKLGPKNPKTRLTTGFNYTNRREYTRSSINTALIYSWQRRLERLHNLTLGNIRFINSDIKTQEFQDELDDLERQGNNLYRTFDPSFVTASTYSIIFNFNEYGSFESRNASFLRLMGESGGTILNLFNLDYLKSEGLEMFKYLKGGIDYRKYSTITSRSKLALRLNAGVARSYAANKILPYEEYFFSGGSNSIRAWAPRRLGPGSFFPTDSIGNYNNDFEQPGEILIEANIELRTKLAGFINSALFFDVGNVWVFDEDPARPGAKFEIDSFIQELAVGTGFGIRLDFSFLLLRLDFGLKLYNPGLPPGERFMWENRNINDGIQRPALWTINLAIGYPF